MEKLLWVFQRILDSNGGKMNGKVIISLAVAAVVVVVGFIVFRLLMVEMVVNLSRGSH
ncbi:hypothetical protein [Nonomuraea sp. NPDC001023]|uniref:hypothetical protein n=1 Tax=unclassified Nonomuraea TaxID=2593643 RepID=UPI00332312D8